MVDASPPGDAPIGVFDSGMGGLTVLRALEARVTGHSFIYLGDTARLPYGIKSPATVRRYALQAARVLVDRGVKALVIACNTASAVALPALRDAFAELPVFGVVDPGAQAACDLSPSGRVVVLATESTVAGGAYQHAILARRRDARVRARACGVLVALAEAGRTDDQLARLALADYLAGVGAHADTLLLGCTHFPVFRTVLDELFDGRVVDSAATTAERVAAAFAPRSSGAGASRTLLATDGADRFRRVGATFLGEPIDEVELVDL